MIKRTSSAIVTTAAVSGEVSFLRRGNSQKIELGFRRERER
jgi:hypothetical protein